ncbi:hypothetical protein HDU91_005422 [Kappamyces sp. JEL0680]|nr:hypothetical protein HDU91_005422 [Kappamyces sp. JEL0680]
MRDLAGEKEAKKKMEKELEHEAKRARDLVAQAQCEGFKSQLSSLTLEVETFQTKEKEWQVEKLEYERRVKELEAQLMGEAAVRTRVESKLDERETEVSSIRRMLDDVQTQTRLEKTGLQKQLEESKRKVRRGSFMRQLLEKTHECNALLEKQASHPATPGSSSAAKSPLSGMKIDQLSSQLLTLTERCRVLQEENKTMLENLDEMRMKNVALTNEKLLLVERCERAESAAKPTAASGSGHEPAARQTDSPNREQGLGITVKPSPNGETNSSPHLRSPIPYPAEKTRRKSHDARDNVDSAREAELINQISTLTAKLLSLEADNKTMAQQVARIATLESYNGTLKHELEKEQRVVVLLQAEVDALPDMIEKYHQERKALLSRVNKASMDHAVLEKRLVQEGSQHSGIPAPSPFVATCKECIRSPLVEI